MLEDDNKMIHKQMSEILELFKLFQNKFEIYEQVKTNRQDIETNEIEKRIENKER